MTEDRGADRAGREVARGGAAERGRAGATEAVDRLGAKLLVTLHQLARRADVAEDEAAALRRAVAEAAHAYGRATGRNVELSFGEQVVHVGGRLLLASRATYVAAAQLGALLARLGATRITLGHDVPDDDLRRLQHALSRASNRADAVAMPIDLSRIRFGCAEPTPSGSALAELPPETRVIRVYALATVLLRKAYEELAGGAFVLSPPLRRIAEELIALGETVSPAALAATVCRPTHDEVERTVSAALLALCMARKLTSDERLLRCLATAALLSEAGKPRAAGVTASGSPFGFHIPMLREEQEAELPAATAFVSTVLGRLTEAGMMRSVVIFETLLLQQAGREGPLYGGERGPAMLARLLARARIFQHRLSKGDAAADVVAELLTSAEDEVDRLMVQLLMAAINVLPTGTLVELEGGRWAKVVSPPLDRVDFGRPLVRLVAPPGAPATSQLFDLDRPVADAPPPKLVRIVAAADQASEELLAAAPLPPAPPPDPALVVETPPVRPRPVAVNLPLSDQAPDSIRPPQSAILNVPRAPLVARGEPAVRGTLETTTLVHLLAEAADDRRTGTLTLGAGAAGSAIYFRGGRPCKTQVPPDVITPAIVGVSKRRGEAVTQRLVDQIGFMMQLAPDTGFCFYVATDMLAVQPEELAAPTDPLPLIMMGVRKHLDYDALDLLLPRIANVPLVFHERATPARLGLKPKERDIVLLIRRRPITLNDMLAHEDVDDDVAQRTVYALTLTRQLVLEGEERLPLGVD